MTNLVYQTLVMKHLIVAWFFVFVGGYLMAQTPNKDTTKIIRICAPSRGSIIAPLLYVVFAKDKMIYKSNKPSFPSTIKPDGIESINVLKDKSATEKYGNLAANGVVEIHLKKEAKADIKRLKADTTNLLNRL